MIRILLVLMTWIASAAMANAQSWPERPVKIVVPFVAGGNVDVTARIVAEQLQRIFRQPFMIENKSGAGGIVGNESVARATPDGYTLLVTVHGPLLFAAETTAQTPYDWRRDFIPITPLSLTPLVLHVHPGVPAKTLTEFIAYARANPGALRAGTPGRWSLNHLLGELMQAKLGLSWVSVHYRGNAPAMNDLVGGHIQMSIDQTAFVYPFVKSAQTRALAVSSTKRVPSFPDVPTFVESGHPELVAATFTGVMAPANTPDKIVSALHGAIAKVLADPAVRSRLEDLGAEPAAMTPAEFRTYLEKEDRTWVPLIRKLAPEKK